MTENENTGSPLKAVQDKVEAIVSSGGDVRKEVEEVVSQASKDVHRSGQSLLDLARSVIDGAGESLRKGAAAAPAEGAFRQVIDGLGDGLSKAALSARMALDEARSQGKRFASEDLKKISEDIGSVTRMYSQTVFDAASKVRTEASSELGGLREHAEHVLNRIKPSLQSAIDAARQDPIGLGKESLGAGLAATRHATGSLFTAMGKLLQEAGQKLTGTEKPNPGS
jgi:ElaB/YqjD/DUF883 family membrane-anchored ribosome-binding protein